MGLGPLGSLGASREHGNRIPIVFPCSLRKTSKFQVLYRDWSSVGFNRCLVQ